MLDLDLKTTKNITISVKKCIIQIVKFKGFKRYIVMAAKL